MTQEPINNIRKKGVTIVLIKEKDKVVFPSMRRAANFLNTGHAEIGRRIKSGMSYRGFRIYEKSKIKL